jgi:hypothetical protein
MNQPKLFLKEAEFYITNSCNFNCRGCNRFNNYSFTGMQRWDDYANVYQRWAEILELGRWTILGGEPMMNPTYLDWLKNILELWPQSAGVFLTNGHFLKANNRELYNLIQNTNGRVTLEIGLHNVNRAEPVLATVKSWLCGEISICRIPDNTRELPNFDDNWKRSYNNIKDPSWPECDNVDQWDLLPEYIKQECSDIFQFGPDHLAEKRKGWRLVDSNGVTVVINPEDYFHQGALKINGSQSFGLHNSDPIRAHAICHSKTCHHFDKGRLYKCGQVALFKEIDQQFHLEVSDEDRALLYAYQPAELNQDLETLKKFVSNIDQPLPQCKFCPEYYEQVQIFAEHRQKVKMTKKSK